MCGIFGYIGSEKASPILSRGLKNLEYRGYDSVGIATVSSRLETRKDAGKIDDLRARLNLDEVEGNVGIGHTRWATHGAVTAENAHPHIDCENKVAIIHNGIIENFYELKTSLAERGHRFASETDSEVIAHLIEDELSKDSSIPGAASSWNGCSFEHACVEAFKKLRGSFAVLAIHEGEEKIVATRKDSPLVLGLADHGTFFASDVAPFLDWTKDVVYLENGDLVVAKRSDLQFFNLDFGEVARPDLRRGLDLHLRLCHQQRRGRDQSGRVLVGDVDGVDPRRHPRNRKRPIARGVQIEGAGGFWPAGQVFWAVQKIDRVQKSRQSESLRPDSDGAVRQISSAEEGGGPDPVLIVDGMSLVGVAPADPGPV